MSQIASPPKAVNLIQSYHCMIFNLGGPTSSPCEVAMDAIETRDAREAIAVDRGSWGHDRKVVKPR